jgi:hypothetical protein
VPRDAERYHALIGLGAPAVGRPVGFQNFRASVAEEAYTARPLR